MYHSSRVARDRDRLRAEILRGLGWKLHRIWSPSWYRDRANEEARLKAAIEVAAQAPIEVVERRDELSVPSVEQFDFEEIELDTARTWTTEYNVSKPQGPRYRHEMHLPEAATDIRRMVLEVVNIEAPIHSELALRRVREAWSVGRAGERIWNQFSAQLQVLERTREIDLRGDFIWKPGQQLTHVRVGGLTPDTARKAGEIPPEEIDLALAHIAADAVGAGHDDLTEQVGRVLGWNRRGSDIQDALTQSVMRLVAARRIEDRQGRLYWIGGELPNHGSRTVSRVVRAEPAKPQMAHAPNPPAAARAQVARASPGTSPAAFVEPTSSGGRPAVPPDIGRCLTPAGARERSDLIAKLFADRSVLTEKVSTSEGNGSEPRDQSDSHLSLTAVDGKLTEARRILDESRVIEYPNSTKFAAFGLLVTIQEEGGPEEIYQLVGPLEADPEQFKVNVTSPLGSSLYGREVGDEVTVRTPNGDSYKLTVLGISAP
jgi:transcription elongation GreA/GreB family factor